MGAWVTRLGPAVMFSGTFWLIFARNIRCESGVRGQRKCLFLPDQSSVATASFCARYMDMNAMCHGLRGCLGDQVGSCG